MGKSAPAAPAPAKPAAGATTGTTSSDELDDEQLLTLLTQTEEQLSSPPPSSAQTPRAFRGAEKRRGERAASEADADESDVARGVEPARKKLATVATATAASPVTPAAADAAAPAFSRGVRPEERDALRRRMLDTLAKQLYTGADGAPANAGDGATAALGAAPSSSSSEAQWKRQNPWTVDIRDAQQRAPTHPDYDPRTLFVPPRAMERLTPFQRQFWAIKSRNYDVVLLFKKGKFYEMYDVDADLGHSVLELNYTGGGRVDMRCVGVPESAFGRHATKLVDCGYKVGRVEQVETVSAARSSSSKVCDRQLVKVLTKGTYVGDESAGDPRYFMAIVERGDADNACVRAAPLGAGGDADDVVVAAGTRLGVCYIDASTATVHFGALDDDAQRTQLETVLSRTRPREVLLDRRASERTGLLARSCSAPDVSVYPQRMEQPFDAARYGLSSREPASLRDADELALLALGGASSYLASLKIDAEVFPLRNFLALDDASAGTDAYPALELDAAALENLELLANSYDHTPQGSLFAFVDRCATPMGRRALKRWVCRPFRERARIEDRLDALEDLRDVLGEQDMDAYQQGVMRALPDLERAITRLHAAAVDSVGAIMFDDTNKRKVREFVSVLDAYASALRLLRELRTRYSEAGARPRSRRLGWLLSDSAVPLDATAAALEWFFDGAFDVATARTEGVLRPQSGADAALDEAVAAQRRVEQEFDEYLQSMKGHLREPSLRWHHRAKESYQLEVPAHSHVCASLPADFSLMSQAKPCKRYWTPRIRELVKRHTDATERVDAAEQDSVRKMLARFDEHHSSWLAVARVLAELDALMALTRVSLCGDHDMQMCRPRFEHPTAAAAHDDEAAAAAALLPSYMSFRTLRHPCLAARMGASRFVPNDVLVDARQQPVVVLTGPNMSGKSALLRQVSLAVVLAQMGCYVPAAQARLGAPVDRIFTRIGARDRITRGQSTFLVEMHETAAVLEHATSRSLVILDELGRGTSTFDGYAIAYAVLQHLAHRVQCLTLFSTHYHMLTEDVAQREARVALYHMSAMVDERQRDITFLYKFARGAADKSRGIYCAKMAGVDAEATDRAEAIAEQFELSLGRHRAATAHADATGAGRDGGGGRRRFHRSLYDAVAAAVAPGTSARQAREALVALRRQG